MYYENLNINKTITLASLALYDDLSIWYEIDSTTEEHIVTNDNILNTIIDGSQPVNEDFTSAIVVQSPENDCISPVASKPEKT